MAERSATSEAWKAGTGQKIERLYAWVAEEPDGGEGVCSMALPGGIVMPLIGADKERIESLRSQAAIVRRATGYPVKLKLFSGGVVLDEIA